MPLRDPHLPHQPVIENSGANSGAPTLNCNCRKRIGLGPMAIVPELTDTVMVYNDPENHVEPFGEEWMLNGQRSQGV